MARSYSVPSYSTFSMDRFKGVDLSVPEDQVKPYRAAWSQNMIPGEIGEIKKRPGVKYDSKLKGIEFDDDGMVKDGGSVIEMIGGKYPVVFDEMSGLACYKLFYKNGKKVLTSYYKPVPIYYGKGWLVFATMKEDEPDQFSLDEWKTDRDDWRIGGKTSGEEYEFFTAMVIFDIDEPVRVYTDTGRCCTMAEDGTWKSERISKDDPFLTTPTIFKGCNPAGGGSTFQQVNLLSPWVTESFCCTAEQTSTFYLNDKVTNETGEAVRWGMENGMLDKNFYVEVLCTVETSIEGSDDKQTIARWIHRPFAPKPSDAQYGPDGYRPVANRLFLEPASNGTATYTESGKTYKFNIGYGQDQWIGKTPIDGEDNVRITHWRADFGEGFRKVCAAACGTVFGVGGYKDRLFLGGYQEGNGYRERIYYSELEDPFYIGDLDYIKLEDGCQVMALDGTADALAALTDKGIYMIQAKAQNNTDDIMYISDALFAVSGKVLAPAPLHYGDTEVLGGEIVYLSKEGIIAVAYKEHFDERFAEHRSALIDPQMMKDEPQQLISLGRFLMVRCKDGVWWLLDENQPNAEGDKPYSSHQYEGWRLTGMPADAAWEEYGALWLLSGSVVCKWTDGSQKDHYCDNYTGEKSGERAIEAYWDTPWIYGSAFHLDKNFIKMGVLLGEISVKDGSVTVPIDSAVRIEMRKNDEDEKDWKILWDYNGVLCTFDYGRIDYRLFTYSGEPGCPDLEGKIKIKKAKRVKFRFSNDFINQGLILRRFCLNYVQEG